MIERIETELDLKKKCWLLNVARSGMYYQPRCVENDDAVVMNEVRDIYQKAPFYGYRRILVDLRKMGFLLNHKRLQKLLGLAGIKAVYPKKRTSLANRDHKVFPYLLRDLKIERPNQVWSVDITYIKIRHGFVYLVCLIDIFSRKIMGWSLSTFLDTNPCIEAFENGLKQGKPEIINSDQGCQFTSAGWINRVSQNDILVSMDGKGRWVDNVYVERLWRSIKYESVYLFSFDTVDQAHVALRNYIDFYNQKRPHQALNYHTPDAIFNLKRVPTKQELFAQFRMNNLLTTQEVAMTPK